MQNRAGKLRLDFNENTVGCSPRVIAFLTSKLCEDQLSIYPEYTRVKPALATFFKVKPDDVAFVSSNRWDIMGAASFGFRAVWVNRSQLPDEYPHQRPAHTIPSLSALPSLAL